MKRFLFNLALAAGCIMAPPAILAEDVPVLYGTMLYSDGWDSNEYGVYAINANSSPVFTKLAGGYGFNANAGAAYCNGSYVVLNYSGSGNRVTYYEYETEDWGQTDEDDLSANFMGMDYAVDPTDGTLYGVCSDMNGGIELAKVNFPARTRTAVAPLSRQIICLAVNSMGKMYGITSTGMFVEIDKTTGAITNIGSTGLTPAGLQSATFDLATNTLYWAASLEDDMEGPISGLYRVNVENGRASLVKRFPYCEQIVGLYSLSSAAPWEGPDHPVAPIGISVSGTRTADSYKAEISWTAPDKGLHGGEVNPADLTYTITRLPDNTVVAEGLQGTSFTDEYAIPAGATYVRYRIVAYNGELEGEPATSDVQFYQGGVVLPYNDSLTDPLAFGAYTIINADGDSDTWQYSEQSGSAFVPGQPFDYTNDWLVSPMFHMSTDRLYKVSVTSESEFAGNYPYNVGFYNGNGTAVGNLTNVVYEKERINDNDAQRHSAYFRPAADGENYVAVRCYGYDIQYIAFRDLAVEAGPMLTAPSAPTDLALTAGENGSRKVDLSFKAPATDNEGNPVGQLTKIEIYADGTLAGTIENPSAGETLSYTHNTPADRAVNLYKVIAYNAQGFGLPVEGTVYVGLDAPVVPVNVKLVDNVDKAVLTWELPATGVHGGYVDPSTVTYELRRFGDNAVETVSGCSYEAQLPASGEQSWFLFYVKARNGMGMSEEASSNSLVSGTPYGTPFYEGFPDAQRTHFWGSQLIPEESNWCYWSMQQGEDVDGDNGHLHFTHGQPGNRSHMFSGKIDLSGAAHPVLEYWYQFRAEENEFTFDTYIQTPGGNMTKVKSLDYVHYREAKPYQLVRVPLDQFMGSEYVQVLFDGLSGDDFTIILLDGIEVRDYFAHDLRGRISVPVLTAAAGDVEQVKVTVLNRGSETSGSYTVNLYDGDRIVATAEGDALEPDKSIDYDFNLTVGSLESNMNLRAEIVYGAEQNPDDNVSESVEVAVTLPEYPVPASLEAEDNGSGISLTWSAPDYQNFTPTVVEGAENLTHGSSDLGEWMTVDADGKNTVESIYIGWDPYTLPGMGSPMGFVALNPATAEIPFYNWFDEPTGWEPVGGSQLFASYAVQDGAADDWLISPELNGEAQEVVFHASGSYNDKLEMMVSTTDAQPASFTSLGIKEMNGNWQTLSAQLPAGARHFAIRNITDGYGSFVAVDDIKYRPLSAKGSLQLEGYSLYCDGDKVADIAATETAHLHVPAANGTYRYQLTARYSAGESAAAETVAAYGGSGVEGVAGEAPEEIGRYSIDGCPVGKDYRGVVIVRYSDGTSRKIVL